MQIGCLLLAIIMCLSIFCFACSPIQDFDLSKVSYEGYDFDSIKSKIERYENVAKTSANGNVINSAIADLQNDIDTIATQYRLIELQYVQDRSDEAVETEYLKVYDEYNELIGAYYNIVVLGLENTRINWTGVTEEDLIFYRLYRDMYYGSEYETQASEIEAKYNRLGISTFEVGGEQMTMNNVLATNDSALINAWFEQFATAAGDLLIDMRDVRNAQAKDLGYNAYADLAYEIVFDRDFTPEESKKLHSYVKTNFGDFVDTVYVPFRNPSAITQSAISGPISNMVVQSVLKNYFAEVSPDMTAAYNYLDRCNLYVTSSSENAHQGAFTGMISKYNSPVIYQYIYNPSSPMSGDISTFVHEFGHFYADYVNGTMQGDDGYTNWAMDISEIHSQANEWLFTDYYDDLFGLSAQNVLKQDLCSSVIYSIIAGCMMDELQQIVYSDTTIDEGQEVTAAFEGLIAEYGMAEMSQFYAYDYKYWWSIVSHSFSSPFYYISYATSCIPAIEIYRESEIDRSATIRKYDTLVKSSADYTFKSLLTASSLPDIFSESTHSALRTFIDSKFV